MKKTNLCLSVLITICTITVYAFEPLKSELIWLGNSVTTQADADALLNYLKSDLGYVSPQKICFNGRAPQAAFSIKGKLAVQYNGHGAAGLDVSFAKDENSEFYGPFTLRPCIQIPNQYVLTYIVNPKLKKCLSIIENLSTEYGVSAGSLFSAKIGEELDIRIPYSLIKQGDIIVGKATVQLLITAANGQGKPVLNSCDVKVECCFQ